MFVNMDFALGGGSQINPVMVYKGAYDTNKSGVPIDDTATGWLSQDAGFIVGKTYAICYNDMSDTTGQTQISGGSIINEEFMDGGTVYSGVAVYSRLVFFVADAKTITFTKSGSRNYVYAPMIIKID